MPLIESFRKLLRHLRDETYVLYFAARHPGTPWYAKLFVAVVVAYALSPIDLIPDFIPVLGYLDDVILIPIGIAIAVRLVPREVLAECRVRAREAAAGATPSSRTAAAVVVATWVVLALLCGYWAYRSFA